MTKDLRAQWVKKARLVRIMLDFYSQPAKKPRRLLDRFQDNPDDCEPPAQDTSKPTLEQLGAKCLEYQNEIEGLKKHVQDLKAELAFLKTKPAFGCRATEE